MKNACSALGRNQQDFSNTEDIISLHMPELTIVLILKASPDLLKWTLGSGLQLALASFCDIGSMKVAEV